MTAIDWPVVGSSRFERGRRCKGNAHQSHDEDNEVEHDDVDVILTRQMLGEEYRKSWVCGQL